MILIFYHEVIVRRSISVLGKCYFLRLWIKQTTWSNSRKSSSKIIFLSLADPVSWTDSEYTDHSLTFHWPCDITNKNGKKTFKSLQLWFCDQIWIRRCRNKHNNFIFQEKKLEKHPTPLMEGSAVVHHLRNVSTVRVDNWLEYDTTTFYLTSTNSQSWLWRRSANDKSLHCLRAFHDRCRCRMLFADHSLNRVR